MDAQTVLSYSGNRSFSGFQDLMESVRRLGERPGAWPSTPQLVWLFFSTQLTLWHWSSFPLSLHMFLFEILDQRLYSLNRKLEAALSPEFSEQDWKLICMNGFKQVSSDRIIVSIYCCCEAAPSGRVASLRCGRIKLHDSPRQTIGWMKASGFSSNKSHTALLYL